MAFRRAAAPPPVDSGLPGNETAVAGMTMVTIGSMVANLAGYLLQVSGGRWLGLGGYSEFATLLSAQLWLAVPALAIQTVIAREVVHGATAHELRRLQHRCALIVGVVAALLVPVISTVLHVGVAATIAALAAVPVLLMLCGEQGILQGSGRFRELALVLGAAGICRVVPAMVLLALGAGATAALFASAVGSAVAALGARLLTGDVGADGAPRPFEVTVASVMLASQVQLALVAMTSVDLVIARIVLNGDDASVYALGAIATKAAFWLAQAVGVVLYPRMSHPDHSARALRSAVAVLVGIGALAVAGVAIASPLVPMIVGDDFAPIKGLLWAFALDGAALAVLQVALLYMIAGGRTRLAIIAWIGLAAEIVLMLTLADSIGQLIAVATTAAIVTAVVACVTALKVSNAEQVVARPSPE